MESTCMVVWSGLDGALSDDGDCGLVGLETGGLGKGDGVLRDPTRFQCSLDSNLFRRTSARLGAGGYHRDVGGDCGDDDCVFPRE